MKGRWVKHYEDPNSCRRAANNHRWFSGLDTLMALPELHSAAPHRLEFEYVPGRHAAPGDLPMLAALLGQLHHQAYASDLHRAQLDQPLRTRSGHHIPDFLNPRLAILRQRLAGGSVPGPALNLEQAQDLLESVRGSPAVLYKDTNPRNILITPNHIVLVDFDDLTLAPLGYDLAKLIVTLTMTHGPLTTAEIEQALTVYNTATGQALPCDLPPVSWNELLAWAEVHHILTSAYLGRGGYRHSWHEGRPTR